MAGTEFLDIVRDALGGAGLGKIFTPVLAPDNPMQVVFSGVGISFPGDAIRTGWRFAMVPESPARQVQTFSAGTVSYEPGPAGQPGRLILRNADVLGNLVRGDSLPDWFPLPHYVIYRSIDPASIRSRMKDYFARSPRIGALLQRQRGPVAGALEDAFMSGPGALPPVPVPAGQILGEAMVSVSGSRVAEIYMQQELDNAAGLFLDPAIYHLHWRSFFADLENHPLRGQLTRPFAGPIANGVARYVAKNGGDNAPYLTAGDAANSVQDAIEAADRFDTVVIIDAETYDEGDEISITKPLALTSLGTDYAPLGATPTFPKLDGDDDNRVVRIQGADGVVSLSNLEITRGLVDGGPIPRAGAGILIERVHSTYVSNCNIHHNENERTGVGNANGFGAGIHCHHASPFLYGNTIAYNRCADNGGGIGVWGQGWPIIEANVIVHNETRAVGASPRPDGGGIGIENGLQEFMLLAPITDPTIWDQQQLATARRSATRIIDNEIAYNEVDDDGGGIYLTWLSRAELRNNNIHHNKASKSGGGIRATEACELALNGDQIRANEANFEQADPAERRNGGGGMGLRNASARLRDVVLEGNIIHGWAGGALFFNSVDLDDGEDEHATHAAVLNNILQPGQYRLEIDGGAIQDNHSRLFLGDVADHRKGAGVYVLRASTPPFGGPGFGLPFAVTIQDINRIAGNHLDPGALPLAAPQSVEIHVEDQVHRLGNPIDDANKAAFVTGSRFFYESP